MTSRFEQSLRKGQIGERIVDRWLIDRGFVPYHPIDGVAHPFDRLVASKDKSRLVVVEVKTKPRRYAYPDTGIDERHYQDYMNIWTRYRIPVFLAFVDEDMRKVYGATLKELVSPRGEYPWHYRNIVYFPLSSMRDIAPLSDDDCTKLKALRRTAWRTTRNQERLFA